MIPESIFESLEDVNNFEDYFGKINTKIFWIKKYI